MDPTPPDPRDDPERASAQAFQAEAAEHTAPSTSTGVIPLDRRPATGYQHEDDTPTP
jgi:hypothetical protein